MPEAGGIDGAEKRRTAARGDFSGRRGELGYEGACTRQDGKAARKAEPASTSRRESPGDTRHTLATPDSIYTGFTRQRAARITRRYDHGARSGETRLFRVTRLGAESIRATSIVPRRRPALLSLFF